MLLDVVARWCVLASILSHWRLHTPRLLWCDSELCIISVQLITMEDYVSECAALHHLSFAHHNGGVRVGVFMCIPSPLPHVPTPPFITQATSATFLVK